MPTMIVTGAASGLGQCIAEHAARAGYKVGVLDLVLGQAQAVADKIGGIALEADVSDLASVERAFDTFGETPDVLVNNAGILRTGHLLDHSLEDFRRVIDVNLTSVFLVARIAARRMKNAGGGCIINMSSINGINPSTQCGAYATAKAGVIALSKQMSMEWGVYNIRVNTIAPGFIDAGMQAPFFENPAVRDLRSNAVPLKRLGSADDVAECALFLASDKAQYISGENITVDGGVIHSVLMQLPRS
ncbi:MAG: SDR family NAD(P)-dependent oxidoreductase [Halieaceae bacterium]|jgi:NAD(P)-dependent dehydrogenase (short-subunit alcohol dehydrogenase family)|nr:SDR family NAD(P)-dependent oxidoreductase [Halieaceae bacterium]